MNDERYLYTVLHGYINGARYKERPRNWWQHPCRLCYSGLVLDARRFVS